MPPVETMKVERVPSSASDEALVRAAQKGDMAAFEELVARHRDKLYARAYSMMRNEEDAIDLSQEAWVKGWQRLKQFQGIDFIPVPGHEFLEGPHVAPLRSFDQRLIRHRLIVFARSHRF